MRLAAIVFYYYPGADPGRRSASPGPSQPPAPPRSTGGGHPPKAALARAAAAASGHTTGVNVRPILCRAAAGTSAAAALALGPRAPSFAAAIPIITTTNQAGYQV